MAIEILRKKKIGQIPLFERGANIQPRIEPVEVVDLPEEDKVEIVPLQGEERDVDIVDLEGKKIEREVSPERSFFDRFNLFKDYSLRNVTLRKFSQATTEGFRESEALRYEVGEGLVDKPETKFGPRRDLVDPITKANKAQELVRRESNMPKTVSDQIQSAITTITSPQFKEAISSPRTLKLLGTSIIAKSITASESYDDISIIQSGLGDHFIGANEKEIDKLAKENPELANFIESMSFSLTAMVPAIMTGFGISLLPVPGARVAAYAAGAGVAGTIDFNISRNYITTEYLHMKNEESIQSTGIGITIEQEKELKADFKSRADEAALWSAIPEAAGSALGFGVLTKSLTKMFGKSVATKLLFKMGGVYGEEVTTEAITELGQKQLRYDVKLPGGKEINWTDPEDWKAALIAVAPMTAAITFATGGTIGLGVRINTLRKELGEKNQPLIDNFIIKMQELKPGLTVEDISQKEFRDFEDLSTKTLSKLEGKTSVSPQFISDLSNAPDLKQPERDLIRKVLAEMITEKELILEGEDITTTFDKIWEDYDMKEKINVQEFADKVKTELLPLAEGISTEWVPAEYRYENIILPDNLRGNVSNYTERIYESPIKTAAGAIHFDAEIKNYFAHARIEDMADGTTRRVIEAQSDLFQRGRLQREIDLTLPESKKIEFETTLAKEKYEELSKLQPYRNIWHERIIKEEIRKASQDNKSILQFPTGETAMNIEGLGDQRSLWGATVRDSSGEIIDSTELKVRNLKIGKEIITEDEDLWIITDVLGDGKFKALPIVAWKNAVMISENHPELKKSALEIAKTTEKSSIEQFDISGKIDTSNPIYKFYEKDIQKYLKRLRPDMKRVTDAQGVEWFQIDITEADAIKPVLAFYTDKEVDYVYTADPEQMKKKLEKIFGPINFNALKYIPGNQHGFYFDNIINVLQQRGEVSEIVAWHESFHYYLDVFVNKEETMKWKNWILENKPEALDLIKRLNPEQASKLTDLELAEEVLANEFARYMRTSKTWSGKLKAFFDKLIYQIKLIANNQTALLQLFKSIERGDLVTKDRADKIRKDFTSVDPYLEDISEEIQEKVEKKTFKIKHIEVGVKRGVRKAKKIEVKVAKRQVAAQKRETRRQVKKAVKVTSAQINKNIKDKARTVDAVKGEIVRFARKNLSLENRGKVLPIVRDIKNFKSLGIAKKKVDALISQTELDEALVSSLRKERNKVTFLKKLAQLNQTAINDIKKKLGIDKPLRKLTFEELDKIVFELRERLQFKREKGAFPRVSSTVQEVSENTYLENRMLKNQKKFSLADTRKSTGKVFKRSFDPILTPISTRLKVIHPSLKHALRKFEYHLGKQVQSDKHQAKDFVKGLRKLDKNEHLDLDLALKNGDRKTILHIVKKNNLEEAYTQVKDLLDNIYDRADAVGFDIGYRRNYFPRVIKDTQGFLDYIQGTDDWSLLEEGIKRKENSLGRVLKMDEKAHLVNTMIRGYKGGIALTETGQMKERKIDLIDGELNQYYEDSTQALTKYLYTINDAIEARRFFGKEVNILNRKGEDITDLDESIGVYITKLITENKIKVSQEKEITDILKARFNPRAMSGVVGAIRDISYVDVLGSPINALTQLGDLAFAFYKGGIKETIKNAPAALINRSKIKKEDLGIDEVGAEFMGESKMKKVSNFIMTVTGFRKLDTLGKNTLISAIISKYQKEYQKRKPNLKLDSKLNEIFGEETDQVRRDLREGYISENVKYLAFTELLDVQPVALSEMPEAYLKAGNGRIFYMLKTWTIKKLDVYRNDVFILMKTDKKQALKNLMRLTMYLVLMEAGVDELKDFVLGRELKFKDNVIDNIAKLFGFSRYTRSQITRDGLGRSLFEQVVPPTQVADSLTKDVLMGYKDFDDVLDVNELRTIKSIPIGGKLYYYWFGKGSEDKARVSHIKSEVKVTIPKVKVKIKPIKIKPIKISL